MPVIGVICRPSGGIIVGIGVAIDFTDRLAAYCANVVTSTGFHTSRSGVNNPFTKSVSGIIRHRGAASVLTLVPVVGAICRPSDGIVVRGVIRGDCFALPFSARAGTLFDAVLGAGGRFRFYPFAEGVTKRRNGFALLLQASAASDSHALFQARCHFGGLPLAIDVGVLGVIGVDGTTRRVFTIACREGKNEG